MEPAGQTLLRNVHDHSPFQWPGLTRASRKKFHGDFLRFFRGISKVRVFQGQSQGAFFNSGFFSGISGVTGHPVNPP